MAERINGGPWVLGPGQTAAVGYWWGDPGDDRRLAYACAHPLDERAQLVSFDQRIIWNDRADGGGHVYGVTIRNEGPDRTSWDLYATTP